jgi:4-cresol dehydrogenase (hydroxylating) flavoprotein subunit
MLQDVETQPFEKFRAVVGDEHLLIGPERLARYAWCTTAIQRTIAGVLRPESVDQVQRIVQIARDHQVPIYPISTGNNWGYGSAQPMRDGHVILDLGRMNRIVEVNTELAYAVLEPGVTQQMLYDHLRGRGIPLWLNPTGAGPHCSILGNALERGFGIGPNGDHFMSQCGMEVVLGTGEILKTGFGHYPGARATHVYKWGVGPYLDGLFTQSSSGIVTKMGVWLTPVPEYFEACYFSCYSEEQIGPVIETLRKLLFSGVFQGPVNLLHRNRVLIMMDRYPWEAMKGETPLSEAVSRELAARKQIGIWNGVGALCGSRYQVQAAKRTIKEALGSKVDRLTFLSDKRLQLLERFPKALSVALKMNVPELLRTLKASYRMMKGVPSEIALGLAYWRNKRTPSANEPMINPARDNCGLMWFAPIIPMTPADVATFRAIVTPILEKFGFECCLTLTAVNERCFDCTLPLLFDKDDAIQARRAEECYKELVSRCLDAGYVAYRLGLQSMQDELARGDVFWEVADRLKRALDPQGILSPGRYSR